MNPEMRTQAVELLGMTDDAYFAVGSASLLTLTQRLAKMVQPPPMSRPPGKAAEPLPELRAFTAPARIDLKQRTSFPLLVAEIRSHQREWAVASEQNGHAVVSNLSTGDVVAVAQRDERRRMPPQQPSGTGTPVDAFNATLSSIDVTRRDLALWMPANMLQARLQGQLALTLLDYDLMSNTRMVQTIEPVDPPVPVPMGSKPRIVLNPEPLAADAPAAGVALGARAGAAPSSLHASFRLPRNRLTLLEGKAGVAHPLLVAASLVLVQLDKPPVVVDLAIGIAGDARESVQAAFTVDLAGRAEAGHHLAYLVIGDTVTGPTPVHIPGR